MATYRKSILIFSLLFIISCSSSFDKLTNNTFTTKDEFSKYLLESYKEKAIFEAREMHDWDSAKLYSEKALKAVTGHKILPQHINYWKIPSDKLNNISKKRLDLIKAYNNLMIVYDDALLLDPFNLAKAISSLDCWSEQQEENWQTWDIKKCRDNYLDAMHALYNATAENQKENKEEINPDLNKNSPSNDSASIVTQNNNGEILQIIYFDFDKFNLSNVSINKIKNYIEAQKNFINKFIIIGHTDTKGTQEYNMKLSLERAESVKKILLKLNIKKENIKILGRGENDLSVATEDEVPHPANRRAEISLLN